MFHVPLTYKKCRILLFNLCVNYYLSSTTRINLSHANQVEMIEPLKIHGFADTRDELVNAMKARYKILLGWMSVNR